MPPEPEIVIQREGSSLISNLVPNSPLNTEQAKQKIANVWSRLQSNYSFIAGTQHQTQHQKQQQQQQQQQHSNIIPQAAIASSFDDFRNRRLYKMDDKDHPLSVLKVHYEHVVQFLREQPIVFAKCFRGIIRSQHMTKEAINQGGEAARGVKESERLVFMIVYTMYGNHTNPLENKCILKFIKHSIRLAFENCQKITDIMKNNFIRNLLTVFMKREGLEFFRFLISEALFELLQNDDFDVRLDVPIHRTRRASHSEANGSSRRSLSYPSYSPPMSPVSPIPSLSLDFEPGSRPRAPSNTTPELLAQDLKEKRLRTNKINLYTVCNKIISCLASNVVSIPFSVRVVLGYLVKSAQNRFPMAKMEQKVKVLKAIFFQFFIIPGILDPERAGASDFVVLPSLKNKLTTVTHVLSHIGVDRQFDDSSPFRGMNVFIDQNRSVVDKIITQLIDNNDKSMAFNIFHRISSSLHSHSTSKSLEKAKERYELSPICISTEDLKLLLQILVQSSFVKSPDVPQGIRDGLTDILNWHVNPLTTTTKEKFMIMNLKEINVQDQLPDETPYSKNLKADSIKYLIQQVLISVKYIESNVIVPHKAGSLSIEDILESVYVREMVHDRMITATTIKELLLRLKSSPKNARVYFMELRDDICSRRQLLDDIMHCHKRLLADFDLQQEHIQSLTVERDKLNLMLENSRFLPFFQSFNLSDFMLDFRKCAFVEDQEKKLRNQFFRLKGDLTQYAQRNFIPQAELENAFIQLMRLLLKKVYRLLVSPKGSPFEKKDEAISKKNQKMAPEIKPAHLEIPNKYRSICDCRFVQEELLRLDMYVLPRDKMSCITKCSSILIELMRLSGDDAPSIDNFLPILIFNLIRANPPRLFSNLKYITRFDELFSEHQSNQPIFCESRDYTGEYWLRHFEAAILFLEGLEVEALLSQKINSASEDPVPHVVVPSVHREVDRQFVRQQSRTLLTPTQTMPESTISSPSPVSSPTHEKEIKPFTVVEAKTPVDDIRRASLKLSSPPTFHSGSKPNNKFHNFRFVNVSVDDLKFSDIPNLMKEYMYAVQQLQQLSSTLFPHAIHQDSDGFNPLQSMLSSEDNGSADDGSTNHSNQPIDPTMTEAEDLTFTTAQLDDRTDAFFSDDEESDNSSTPPTPTVPRTPELRVRRPSFVRSPTIEESDFGGEDSFET